MIPILCNCLQSSPTSTYRVVFVFLWTHSQSVSRLCFCVLSFKDNFEVNNEIKDVTKPLRLLSTFCWHRLWGLRRPYVLLFLFFSWVLNCRTHLSPPSFLTAGCSLGPGEPICFFSCGPCCPVSYRVPSDPWAAVLPILVPTVSTAKCDASIFFCFCIVFVFLFWIFPLLLRLCPEKTSFACLLLFLHTFVYITFTSLFSIVCAKTDRFKRVSKKLF